MSTRHLHDRRVAATLLLAALTACGRDPGPRRIAATRAALEAPKLGLSSFARFGYEETQDLQGGAPGGAPSLFLHDAPADWEALPPQEFRHLNFRIRGADGASTAECYVTYLPGMPAGGESAAALFSSGAAAANLNRWRQQMSLPPLAPAELDALPRRPFVGMAAALLDVEGTFAAPGGEGRPGYRMLGLYAPFPAFAVSAKLVGPAALVAGQVEAFLAFAASVRFDREGILALARQDAGPPAGAPVAFEVPAGWSVAWGGAVRLATFRVAARPAVECWITVLPGDAGGVADNVNRWRRELGREPLAAEEFARLERVDVLGAPATLVEVEAAAGSGAPGGEEPDALLGLVAALPGQRVFVKMVGPASDLRAERGRFLELVGSLR